MRKSKGPLTKEDWTDWHELPQTKKFFESIKVEREDMLLQLTRRIDLDPILQSRLIGIMSGLQKVLDHEINYDYTN